ncbi:heme exporter protein CcmB [Pacificimonas sp. WHA3]|uniref:Heme exporter protein B n=1 Tax=Pacificimonas pallii TaxID=2827236 RepID=A0ABS6SDM1_9SPHN|nr:heme exporter protein CcmB [Pacificimonas pallii]MBV7256188.1 heme exporter protein CcmB [Pacificimonas pallii]
MTLARLIRRHVRLPEMLLPVVFFLIIVSLTAFAVGPDAAILARIGPGTIWIAALLASLLPIGTLIAEDLDTGAMDRLRISGLSLELIMFARMISHWLGLAPALVAAAVLSIPLLGIDAALIPALLIGSSALAALGVIAAALTAGSRAGTAIAGVVVLPFALPVLIFGSGGSLRLTAAAALLLVAIAPFAAAASLRAAD